MRSAKIEASEALARTSARDMPAGLFSDCSGTVAEDIRGRDVDCKALSLPTAHFKTRYSIRLTQKPAPLAE